ncbi:MAG: sulfotransferase domain-containing protein [bacterium]
MNSALRKLVPPRLKEVVLNSPLCVRHKSTYVNIFHCCVWKTGSRWIRRVLGDRRTFRYSGLRTFSYHDELPGGADYRPLNQRGFERPFPQRTIVSPLYVDFENYGGFPKPDLSRAFFVMRDPRDVLVSWYFSISHSHPSVGVVEGVREVLATKSLTDGLLYCIDALEEKGLFPALRSWASAPTGYAVKLVRFEELVGRNNFQVVKDLLIHCDIRMNDDVLRELLGQYSFERMSGGRKPGEEERDSNYRKGTPGDWKNYFDPVIDTRFSEVTGDLVDLLGYGDDSQVW